MDILVTVGMGPWPFDRLLRAVRALCKDHQVFVQTGTSRVGLPCSNTPFVAPDELRRPIQSADVVITHAGNTVRLVQRAGKVPIAVARTAAAGEMPNDHQVEYLRHEERTGLVIAAWDLGRLSQLVADHPRTEARLLRERALPPPTDPATLTHVLDCQVRRLTANPFRYHPLRRYAFAWEELFDRTGYHLDVGSNTGAFVGPLVETTRLHCFAVDPHPLYVQILRQQFPRVDTRRVPPEAPLPFADASFGSVSVLDVLEHARSEEHLLSEIHRILDPGGLMVLSVPARHVFSWLDPDNFKVRFPRAHRLLYSLRFGKHVYYDRFEDRSNGLWGEMSSGKIEHTNYEREWLLNLLETHGFEIARVAGTNLFWRWLQLPQLVGPKRMRLLLERGVWLDGIIFHQANLFVTARKRA